MMTSVFLKTVYDKRWFVLGWMIGFAALAALMVAFYPAMHQDGSLDQLVKTMPPAFQGLVGDLSNLQQFSTYLASQLFDIRITIIGSVMVIILALGLTVAEEESGQSRTLLSLPISRTKLFIQKWLAMVTVITTTVIACVGSIYVMQITIDESIDHAVLWRLIAMTWLLLVTLGTIVFSLAIGTGNRAIATGLGILVVAGSFILTTFSAGVDWLRDYEMVSLFYYFPAVDIAKTGATWEDVAMLSGITLLTLILSWLNFRRRDIG